jgi:hypothetical protein
LALALGSLSLEEVLEVGAHVTSLAVELVEDLEERWRASSI